MLSISQSTNETNYHIIFLLIEIKQADVICTTLKGYNNGPDLLQTDCRKA